MMPRLTNLAVIGVALLVGLLLVEIASRYIMPISPGVQLFYEDGRRVGALSFRANNVYRQVSTEFDALTTINEYGNRELTSNGNPEIIFIGDSFTFGHGLEDKDTFASIYCKSLNLRCSNLAKPGMGTKEEIDSLDYTLSELKWRPKTVKLIFLAMTSALSAGNDIYDNYLTAENATYSSTNSQSKAPNPSVTESSLDINHLAHKSLKYIRDTLLSNSNLGRFIYFSIGHQLRSIFSPPASKKVLEIGLKITKQQLNRFIQLSRKFDFTPEVFLIHPVHDLTRGTYKDTAFILRETMQRIPLISTAEIFLDEPRKYYFTYDGHWNALGAKKIAEFLERQHQ
jgi:hypothetical protein